MSEERWWLYLLAWFLIGLVAIGLIASCSECEKRGGVWNTNAMACFAPGAMR